MLKNFYRLTIGLMMFAFAASAERKLNPYP